MVTSHCRDCRREAYYQTRYPKTICAQCRKHRKLNKNKVCVACNEESALRQCRGPCRALLPLYLNFYGTRKVCRDCSKAARDAAEAKRSEAAEAKKNAT
jgi:hypothetical protein